MFQHTAARRRLGKLGGVSKKDHEVSTHSRPKAAGLIRLIPVFCSNVSTHSRPKAAGLAAEMACMALEGFQHTAARRRLGQSKIQTDYQHSFNTQPPEGGWLSCVFCHPLVFRFNTQPPEGGWGVSQEPEETAGGFNTQPPEGGWII